MRDDPDATLNGLPADAPWWARWVVSNWRDAWRWISVQLAVILGAVPIAYENVALVREYVSASTLHHAIAVLALLQIVGRLKNQSPPACPPNQRIDP